MTTSRTFSIPSLRATLRPLMLALGLIAIAPSTARAQTIRAQQVASGLSQPLGLYYAPGETNRVFILEQPGRVRILDLTTNPPTLSPTPLLNISPTGSNLTNASGEQGLLGLAFDPNFATNGRFYINFTLLGTGATVIDRYTVNGTPSTATTANTASRTTLLTWNRPRANHNGGAIAFGPDGMLYIGAGDSGGANDPDNLAVNLDALQGKILRLDVNDSSTTDGDGLYVPNDNPFVAAGGSVRPYIWAYGMRNPWRLTFDRGTGDMYIGDVGQDAREEIDWQPRYVPGPGGNFAQVAGRHYGWDCREGLIAAPGGGACNPNAAGYTNPIADFTHGSPDNACSITGGHVYRGSAIPELVGAYIFADYCGNWVRSLRNTNGVVSDRRDWTGQLNANGTAVNGLVAINDDGAGELYMVSINLGRVYKIVPASVTPCGTCPAPVNQLATVFFDSFDTNLGWTASRGSGTTDGDWERGVPVGNANNYGFNPPFASGGSGSAYVTKNTDPAAGATTSDVDGGAVILTSPAINASRGQITICFDYYLALSEVGGATPDGLYVEVSGNGTAGPFTRVATITTPSGTGCIWNTFTLSTSQLATAGVTNQSDVRIRFLASDFNSPNQSTVEAGIDNVRVQTGNPLPDCNNNGVADAVDISSGTSIDCNNNGIPDECDIASSVAAAIAAGNDNLRLDLDGGPVGIRSAGGSLFNVTCLGCHGTNGTGGANGPNIRNRDRYFIRERIVFNRPALHPGGGFTAYTPQNFADIEAFLADAGSRGRPDGIIDTCQPALVDCNNNSVSDGRELQLGTQIDADYNGVPDFCQCACDLDANGLDVQDIFSFLARWFARDARADFDGQNGIQVQDIFAFLACWFARCPV